MPSVNDRPILQEILNRWNAQRGQHRRAALELIEHLREERQPLEDLWSAAHEEHREQIAELDGAANRIFSRHVDHLRRLEEWKNAVLRLGSEFEPIARIEDAQRWFDRAQALSQRAAEVLRRAAERLVEQRAEFHERLETFDRRLDERAAALQLFLQKAHKREPQLLVSRGRKQPEEEFIEAQLTEQALLAVQLQTLRRRQAHWLGRLYRFARTLEQKAKAEPARFELQKARLSENWRAPQLRLLELRETILTDALIYEASRKKLRWLLEAVRAMRCVEDVYRPPLPFWKRVFMSETFARKNS